MYKIFSHLPTGIYQWDDVSNGSDDWAGRKYELPSGYRIHHIAAFQYSGNHRKKPVNTTSPAVNTVPVTTSAGDHRKKAVTFKTFPLTNGEYLRHNVGAKIDDVSATL